MRFKTIALALFACLALGAFAANTASAAQWTVGTKEDQKITEPGTTLASETVKCFKHEGSELIFHSTLLGFKVTLQAHGVDCLEKAGAANGTAKIDTKAGDTGAHSEGVLTFTTVTVLEPAPGKCTVGNVGKSSSGEVTTEQLTDEVIMDPTAGSATVFDKFFPEVVGGAFVTIEFGGLECPLAGASAPVKGTACGEAVHTITPGTFTSIPTGTLFKVQTVLFGAAQQTTGGCALTLGTKEAQITGAVDNELSGKEAGKPWGAD